MTPIPVPALAPTSLVLCVLAIFFVPLAITGLALINTGLGRSHSAAHVMLASMGALAAAAGAYFICGFAWQGYLGMPAHTILVSGKPWNLIGGEGFFLNHMDSLGGPTLLVAALEILSVVLAAMIPLGAGLDRWRLSASCASTAVLAGWTYPLFAHWVWGGGWLSQLGVNFGLGHGFVDAGGSGTIHMVGGLTALSVAWIVGPRRGKYTRDGMPTAIPGHNAVLMLLGCLLTWIGWWGLNSAGAILFAGIEPERLILVAVNTTLAAAAAGAAAAIITGLRFGRPDVSLTANGWVSGLVAISASCAFVAPLAAVLIGLVAGGAVTFAVEWFELHLGVDDPGGAISVHAVGGLWGLLAVGIFANFPGNAMENGLLPGSDAGQWLAQLVGIATLLGFVLPLTYGLNWTLNLICPFRVAQEGERQGLDLYELGAGAYPEFVVHTDEFTQR